METFFSILVKPSPEQLIGKYDENAHHRNAADDHRGIPFLGDLGDVGAETFRLQGGLSPSGKFSNDTGIPSAPGRGTGARHPEREDRRQDQRPPKGPATQTIGSSCLLKV